MKEIGFVLGLIFLVLFIPGIVEAGHVISKGNVQLEGTEQKTLCGPRVYSTSPGEWKYTIKYEKLDKFVKKIEPNTFYLKDINQAGCPSTTTNMTQNEKTTVGSERRDCIQRLCKEKNETYCRTVCVTFQGPTEFSLFPKEQKYEGTMKDVASIRAAKVTSASGFNVYYTPIDLKPIIFIVIIIIIGILFLLRRKRFI